MCDERGIHLKAQILYWECINEIMEKFGCQKFDFNASIANEVQEN